MFLKSFRKKKKRQAFTLIELLVIISIIGLLATLAMTSLENSRKRSRDTRRHADMKQLQTAVELYYDDHGEYPLSGNSETEGTSSYNSVAESWSYLGSQLSPYLDRMPENPLDPASGCYIYTSRGRDCIDDKDWYVIAYLLEIDSNDNADYSFHICGDNYIYSGNHFVVLGNKK